VFFGVKVEVEGLLPRGGRLDASTTPLLPLILQPALCAAVACIWPWCCCILAGVPVQRGDSSRLSPIPRPPLRLDNCPRLRVPLAYDRPKRCTVLA
jgi:hypothetical protein